MKPFSSSPSPLIPISSLNTDSVVVPPFGIVEIHDDLDVATGTGLQSVKVRRPTGSTGPFAIDDGGGMAASGGPGAYGQCLIPVSHTAWAYYTGASAPGLPGVQVGPVAGSFAMSTSGKGYLYMGGFDPVKHLILVVAVASGSGGSCNTIRFRVGAVIAGTMSAICFIDAVDAGFTLADVPDKANIELPGFPAGENVIVCDPLCAFFNEPAGGLSDRYGWAKYMQPLVPNTCQPTYAYLAPQWEVFALNCVANPEC